MSPEILGVLEDQRRRFPVMWSPSTPSSDKVEGAERALGVAFVDGYRYFLTHFGAGIIGSQTVIGLGCAEAMGNHEESVVTATKRFRDEKWPGVGEWYVISVDGRGNPVGIDPSGSVYISDHDLGRVDRLYGSFEEWIERKCLKRKK
jgi:hypothetical protein